jgi:transposase
MSYIHDAHHSQAAVPDMGILLVSLEMSRSKWLVTSLSPVNARMSRHTLKAGDALGLLALLGRLRGKLQEQSGTAVRVIVVQEAGLDGFWVHRVLQGNAIESHVVDAASVAMPRYRRRAKTDTIDGETLVRTLAAWRRGEPRVCSMVAPPSVEEEDRRRINRERDALIAERIRQTNRIRGLLLSQGAGEYDPMRRDRRERLEQLTTGDGRPLGPQLERELSRALDRVALLLGQIRELEKERDTLLAQAKGPAAQLLRLQSIGPQFATVLASECFYRHFDNRRQVAAFAGLTPSPWQSGQVSHDQGISKAGNPRVRTTMLELAWLWLRYQPGSALSRWFRQRVASEQPGQRKSAIIALARKLLIALWRYVNHGVVPEGALLKTA